MNSALQQEQIYELFEGGLQKNGIDYVLRSIRKHLGMDVAYVSRLREGDRIVEHVDADGPAPLRTGQTLPLSPPGCNVVNESLPPSLFFHPVLAAVPETRVLGMAAHIAVNICLPGGDIYGTLCFFRNTPKSPLGERDSTLLKVFADILSAHIQDRLQVQTAVTDKRDAVRRAMEEQHLHLMAQPIYDLRSGCLTGLECLSRFLLQPPLAPSEWFALAEEVGLGEELELAVVRQALPALQHLPRGVFLALNSSPGLLLSGALPDLLRGDDLSHLVLEITEHALIEDYAALKTALQPLRARGLCLAIDDAGAGYASLRHIISLEPDVIKLDMSLVRDVDRDGQRRALAKALITFANEVGCHLVAEGIETRAEFDVLLELGVHSGQGFFLKPPVSLNGGRLPDLQVALPWAGSAFLQNGQH